MNDNLDSVYTSQARIATQCGYYSSIQDVRLHIRAALARAGAFNDQHVQGAAVLVGVQPQADVFGQQLVLFLSEHGVDLPWGGPGGGAVFLAVTGSALLVGVEAYPHDVRPGTDQDGHKAVIRPLYAEGVFHGRRQVSDNLRQTAAQGLSQQQRRPDYGDAIFLLYFFR